MNRLFPMQQYLFRSREVGKNKLHTEVAIQAPAEIW